MMSKKAFLTFILFAILKTVSYGQKIEVSIADLDLDGLHHNSKQVKVELDRKAVDKAWLKRLKETGLKVESQNKQLVYVVRQLSLPTISTSLLTLYSKIETMPTATVLNVALEKVGSDPNLDSIEAEAFKRFLYDFVVNIYREDLNEQIKAADKEVDIAVKLHDKKVEAGLSVVRVLDRNNAERLKLQKLTIENQAEQFRLKSDSTQNKLEQITALEEINRLRKVTEAKKAKLSTIE